MPYFDQTRQLIELIRNRPCLWDRANPVYKGKAAREHAWLEIFREIDPNYDDLSEHRKIQFGAQITKKWYNIRDSYAKSLKQRDLPMKRPYIYSNELSFLDSVYFEKASTSIKSDMIQLSPERNSNDYEENETDNWKSEFIDMDEHAESVPVKRPRIVDVQNSFILPKESTVGEDNIFTIFASLMHKEDDEDYSFFKSLIPSVKTLSPECKLEFRIEVMKLIKTLKLCSKKCNRSRDEVKNENVENNCDSE